MSTHNMFLWRNKKNIITFHLKKGPNQSCVFIGTVNHCILATQYGK